MSDTCLMVGLKVNNAVHQLNKINKKSVGEGGSPQDHQNNMQLQGSLLSFSC